MSATVSSAVAAGAPARKAGSERLRRWAPLLVGMLLFLALTLPKALAVWQTGIAFSPDDAMRMEEVRDFLGGQGWFDLVPHRMAPDHPFVMHWSRLYDLPLAGLTAAASLIAGPETAGRLVRLLVPAGLYGLFLAGLIGLARQLLLPRAGWAVALLAAGSLDLVSDFLPGHIHHHGVQDLLLLVSAAAFCAGLEPARWRAMAVAGATSALTLAVNLQNMPFIALLGALALLFRCRDPALPGRALGAFAAGLAAVAGLVFLGQVPPGTYTVGACDAFSAPHLLTAWAGAAVLALMALPPLGRLPTGARLLACGAGAAVAALPVVVLYPACLGDPYGGVDPLLRSRWLADVSEALPLSVLMHKDPAQALPIAIAFILGFAACLFAWSRAEGLARRRWSVVLVLAGFAGLGMMWQVRVAPAAQTFVALGAAGALTAFYARARQGWPVPAFLTVLVGLGLTPAGWAAVLPADGLRALFGAAWAPAVAGLPPADLRACQEPANLAGFRTIPPGLVLSTIDPGPSILAVSDNRVLAGPYHRNAYGNRLALTVFSLEPDAAEGAVRDAKADYVAICLASAEVREAVATAPRGLAAALALGPAPAWLEPVGGGQGPWRIFRLRP